VRRRVSIYKEEVLIGGENTVTFITHPFTASRVFYTKRRIKEARNPVCEFPPNLSTSRISSGVAQRR